MVACPAAAAAATPGARGTIRAAGFYRGSGMAEISIDGGVIEAIDDGTVKSHLFRAARKLRQKLEDLR